MSEGTGTRLLQAAQGLFASKGLYGASLANIADELGKTKQTPLHHFRSKEEPYSEILLNVSERMQKVVKVSKEQNQLPAKQLESVLVAMYAAAEADSTCSQIIMRELLESERRLKEVQCW